MADEDKLKWNPVFETSDIDQKRTDLVAAHEKYHLDMQRLIRKRKHKVLFMLNIPWDAFCSHNKPK